MDTPPLDNPKRVKELIEALAASFSTLSEVDKKAVLCVISGGKPFEVEKFNNHNKITPYYDERYAMLLKQSLDKLADAPKNTIVIFKCGDFRMKRKTIQNRLFMSWKYLINFMDTPDQKYLRLRQQIQVREHPEGVQLCWKHIAALANGEAALQPEFRTIEDDIQPWKKSVDRFLEEAKENDKLDIKAALSSEDVQWLNDYLADSADSIVWQINCRRIVLMKNKDLAKAVKDLGIKLDKTDLSSGGNEASDT